MNKEVTYYQRTREISLFFEYAYVSRNGILKLSPTYYLLKDAGLGVYVDIDVMLNDANFIYKLRKLAWPWEAIQDIFPHRIYNSFMDRMDVLIYLNDNETAVKKYNLLFSN